MISRIVNGMKPKQNELAVPVTLLTRSVTRRSSCDSMRQSSTFFFLFLPSNIYILSAYFVSTEFVHVIHEEEGKDHARSDDEVTVSKSLNTCMAVSFRITLMLVPQPSSKQFALLTFNVASTRNWLNKMQKFAWSCH
jgi:hypothetical protein